MMPDKQGQEWRHRGRMSDREWNVRSTLIVVLRDVYGMTYREIGRIFAISKNYARVRYITATRNDQAG